MERIMGNEELEILKELIETQDLTRLNQVKSGKSYASRFEKEFANYINVKHVLMLNSGSAALHTAVAASEIGPGDEVICTPYSYIASSICVLENNAIPIFADIDPNTFLIDPLDIERKINEITKAIIPVHIFGYPADMDRIMSIANKYNLIVIEDACQAYGSKYDGKAVGTIGHFGCFSLQQSKHITCGEGGILVCNDDNLFDKAHLISNYGQYMHRIHYHYLLGWNYRPSELQAAIAIAQLRKLDEFNKKRKEFVKIIYDYLADIDQIKFFPQNPKSEISWWLFPIIYDEARTELEFAKFKVKCLEKKIPVLFDYIPRPNYLEEIFTKKFTYKHGCPFTCNWYKKEVEYKESLCPKLENVLPYLFLIHIHHLNSFEEMKSAVIKMRNILTGRN